MKFNRTELMLAELAAHRSITHEVVSHPGRRIGWELGDTKTPGRFLPQFKTMHWDNECNFSLRLIDDDHGEADVSVVEGRTEWRKGHVTARFYEKPAHGHHYELGGFEIDVEFARKPASNVVAYTLRHKGLTFHKQTHADAPENVLGSYAVYHATKRNNFEGGKEYRTGKAFHIYRCSARDAAGREVWCELDIADELLTVTVPQEFLDSATYPVTVDPPIGYSTIGGSPTSSGAEVLRANVGASHRYTAGSGEEITSFSWYGNHAGSSPVEMAVYTYSGGVPVTRLAAAVSVSVGASSAWNVSGAVSQALSNGVEYVAAVHMLGDHNQYYDSVSGYGLSRRAGTSLPSTWTQDDLLADFAVSFYATYSAAAVPPVLSAPTASSIGNTTATVGCTSDTASGTLYCVVTASATQPSVAQIKAGQDHSGAAATFAASDASVTAGANTFDATGLTQGLTYYAHFVQNDTGGDSNRVSTAAIYPGTYRPISDISVSGWSVTGAATHAAARNENSASDSEYSTSPTLSGTPVSATLGLDRTLAAGSYTVKYRCKLSSGTGFAKLTFLDDDGVTERGNTGAFAIDGTFTTYTVSASLSGNATKVKEEIWI